MKPLPRALLLNCETTDRVQAAPGSGRTAFPPHGCAAWLWECGAAAPCLACACLQQGLRCRSRCPRAHTLVWFRSQRGRLTLVLDVLRIHFTPHFAITSTQTLLNQRGRSTSPTCRWRAASSACARRPAWWRRPARPRSRSARPRARRRSWPRWRAAWRWAWPTPRTCPACAGSSTRSRRPHASWPCGAAAESGIGSGQACPVSSIILARCPHTVAAKAVRYLSLAWLPSAVLHEVWAEPPQRSGPLVRRRASGVAACSACCCFRAVAASSVRIE